MYACFIILIGFFEVRFLKYYAGRKILTHAYILSRVVV